MYGIKERDVIRVKVKYCDDEKDPQIKKFAIDPRLTNYEVLIGLLVKGLNIKRDFVIHYLATDDFGEQFYLPLLSDWDLDAAILTASDPILRLKVNLKHKERVDWRQSYKLYNMSFDDTDDMTFITDLDEWDIVVPGEAPIKLNKNNITSKSLNNLFKSLNNSSVHENGNAKPSYSSSSTNTLLSQMYQHMEKTMNTFHRVFSSNRLNDLGIPQSSSQTSGQLKPPKPPMSDIEFRNYMDNIGRIVQPEEFKRSVYLGGLEPSLRKVGWRLLLNVYPPGLTGRQRLSQLERSTKHYLNLKHSWKQRYKLNKCTEWEHAQIALVSVDVIRTDRNINFYCGDKSQQHVCQLFDILATFCIYHPSIGYYQGMSDIASPLLFVQADEPVAYLCFCSLMQRVTSNFCNTNHPPICCNPSPASPTTTITSSASTSALLTKLQHFNLLLQHLDPELSNHLHQKRIAPDMYFAHRWILLEMKREFAFLDSLQLLEVQWSALPPSDWTPSPPPMDPSLADNDNQSPLTSAVPLVEHSLICSASQQASNNTEDSSIKTSSRVRCYAVRDMTLVTSLIGPQYTPLMEPSSPGITTQNDFSLIDTLNSIKLENVFPGDAMASPTEDSSKSINSPRKKSSSSPVSVRRHNSFSDDDEDDCSNNNFTGKSNNATADIEVDIYTNSESANQELATLQPLPPPNELGLGNPLLMFVCCSMLQEYKQWILTRVHEISDLLLLYQRLNQKHSLPSILNRARQQYDQYLRQHEIYRRRLDEFPELQLSM